MLQKSILFYFIGACFLFLATQCKTQSATDKPPTMNTNKNQPYAAEWKTIDSLEQQGLPASALEKVEQLYQRAEREKASAQMIKCLLYQCKYQASLEEDGLVRAIQRTNSLADSAAFPEKPILQSIAAEMYHRYLESNYWRLTNRTESPAYRSDDIQTWTIKQLLTASHRLYRASLEDDRLRSIPVSDYDAISTGPVKTDRLRPTLYDFLAHRALDFFVNDRSYLAESSITFHLDREDALGPAGTFVGLDWRSEDSLSSRYNVLLLLQDLIRFHLDDKDPAALIDADLKRLEFVSTQGVFDDKEKKYQEALTRLREQYKTHPSQAEITAKLAAAYVQEAVAKPNKTGTGGKNGYQLAYDLCQQAIKDFPESTGASECQEVLDEILYKELQVTTELVNLPGQPFRMLLQYRNISKVYFRLVALEPGERLRINEMNYDDRRRHFRKMQAHKSWSTDLPSSGDYRPHLIELPVEALSTGQYLLLASDKRVLFLRRGGPCQPVHSCLQYCLYVPARCGAGDAVDPDPSPDG